MILHTNTFSLETCITVCVTPSAADLTLLFLSQVDGMDVLCVREATRFAADHCRSGKVS